MSASRSLPKTGAPWPGDSKVDFSVTPDPQADQPTAVIQMLPDDGGHVYPAAGDAGLTVRDWFAGQALHLLASDLDRLFGLGGVAEPQHRRAIVADLAYTMADAMLARRKRQ